MNTVFFSILGASWPWSFGNWIYNYLCNQCLSPLMLWVRISVRVRCTTLCDKVCQWFVTGRWFSLGPPVSSTNKTDCHNWNIVESGIKHHQTNKQTNKQSSSIFIHQVQSVKWLQSVHYLYIFFQKIYYQIINRNSVYLL